MYLVNTVTGVETQLTFDGSEVIYNGWASWVYWEEILGRASQYQAFWWAPNSQMISFLRFDDSPVPKFPLFIPDGVHGEIEWAHYPKAGDPNPNVKLGIAHLKEKEIKLFGQRKMKMLINILPRLSGQKIVMSCFTRC